MANLSNINNKFIVESDGDVGIGVTTALDKLNVGDGNIRISQVGNVASQLILNTYQSALGNTTYKWFVGQTTSANSYSFQIGNGTTPYLHINSLLFGAAAGNVGINETSPDAKLHVMGTTGLPATSGTTFTGTMRLGVSGYGTVMDFGAVGPATGTQWIQVTDSGNQAIQYPLLLQPNGGNVGIGTDSPGAKLEIAGTTEQRYLQVDAIAGFAGISSTMAAMVDFDNAGDGNNVTIKTNNSARTDAAIFSVWNEANSRFLILNNGNTGIGTSSPDQKLEVAGGLKISQGNSRLYFGAANGTDRRALEGNTSGSLLQIGEGYTDIALQGNVGIGTTGPSSILTVYGGGSTTSTLELRGGANGADNATISTQQSMAFQVGSAGATGRSYTFLSGGLGYGSGTALFSIDSNGGTFNRLWPQTTTSGSSSVVQTTLIPEPGIYEYYLQGNPNAGGSSAYTSLQAGLITIAVDYTPAKSVFLRITKHVTAQDGGGSSNIQLNLNVYMLYNGSASGEQSIANKDQSVIYLTVSGYAGTPGSGQILRLTRKV